MMTRTFAETLLFASVAVNAALLIFFASVYRRMMNAVDEVTFKNLTALLVYYSSKSSFMIVALNLPLFGAIPYYYRYGFGDWYINVGLGMWLVTGSIAKVIKLPVYKGIAAVHSDEVTQIQALRRKLNNGNVFQAICYSAATIVMAIGCM